MDNNDINKLITAIDSSLDRKLDKKFKEQQELLELRFDKKGVAWASKTIQEAKGMFTEELKTIGLDVRDYKETQKDLYFIRWFRKLSTNTLTKVLVGVGGIWGVGAAIEYLKSKGVSVE